MLIETYKGIQIMHNATSDEFYTKIIILKGQGQRKDQYLKNARLQAMRDNIDKWFAGSAKKPVLQKVWIQPKHDRDIFKLVEIIAYNAISKEADVVVDNKQKSIELENGYRSDNLFISCKENDAIIKLANAKQAQIDKLNKELSCTTGKLIPLTEKHFS